MRYWYDTEFIEDGKTIDLISIGIVAEDGREYYACHLDAPWRRIKKHQWLMENVVPHLPRYYGDARNHFGAGPNFQDPAFKTRPRIREDVWDFLVGDRLNPRDVELWAWYGAYDHVVLAQLFGRMIDLPRGVPMWTNDLRQEVHRQGLDPERLPAQKGNAHNALDDARHLRDLYRFVAAPAITKEDEA